MTIYNSSLLMKNVVPEHNMDLFKGELLKSKCMFQRLNLLLFSHFFLVMGDFNGIYQLEFYIYFL
jgi:CRISPR/Cas system-associated protein Cas10 (large subunit of type III CRISPR-Cas system)